MPALPYLEYFKKVSEYVNSVDAMTVCERLVYRCFADGMSDIRCYNMVTFRYAIELANNVQKKFDTSQPVSKNEREKMMTALSDARVNFELFFNHP